ncbi:hypothetical protein EVAR_4414_1 [Eumeta japonica]|uniref:Uncharacterized protein n=1 Tax=Eumeta variegata TaxID=151549 RepID=A0A4C1T0B4_EUMVA|nr:hypothetical protein EVAR_4414_1 [Eumeta japonica]
MTSALSKSGPDYFWDRCTSAANKYRRSRGKTARTEIIFVLRPPRRAASARAPPASCVEANVAGRRRRSDFFKYTKRRKYNITIKKLLRRSRAVVNLTAPRKWAISTGETPHPHKIRREVVASAIAFRSVNESIHFPLHTCSILSQEAHNVLVNPLKLQMSMGGSDHMRSSGPHARLAV